MDEHFGSDSRSDLSYFGGIAVGGLQQLGERAQVRGGKRMPDGLGFAERTPLPESSRDRLLRIIFEKSLLKGQQFRLASGKMANYYLDMKPTILDPEASNLIADAVLEHLKGEPVDAIGGLAVGAVPLVSVVCAKSFYTAKPVSGFFVREAPKGHGTNREVDGFVRPGMRAVVVDDVTTAGGSVMKAVSAARGRGCQVSKVITVVDRLEGAREHLLQHGVELVALYTREDLRL